MKKNDVMNVSDSYTYGLDLSGIKLDLHKAAKKKKPSAKRYVIIDLEMTEFQGAQHSFILGANGEVIQFGAVMLDENYNMISRFDSYVKPAFSSVTTYIQELTGITNRNLEGADDFITVFDKYSNWRGEGDITTFCWSKADYNQLWSELEAKGQHRYDLFACLKNFVDLQKVFGRLLSSRASVSLESAMRLLQMEYKGQIHSAYSDSFNTARILHKLCCTESLEVEFDYINPKDENKSLEEKKDRNNYSCSFASFLSPELLERYGLSAAPDEETDYYEGNAWEEDEELLLSSPLAGCIDNEEIKSLCSKYKITLSKWLKLATEVFETDEMLVA